MSRGNKFRLLIRGHIFIFFGRKERKRRHVLTRADSRCLYLLYLTGSCLFMEHTSRGTIFGISERVRMTNEDTIVYIYSIIF